MHRPKDCRFWCCLVAEISDCNCAWFMTGPTGFANLKKNHVTLIKTLFTYWPRPIDGSEFKLS